MPNTAAMVLVETSSAGTSRREWPDVATMVEALVLEAPVGDPIAALRHLAFVAGVEDACEQVRVAIARRFQAS